MKDERLLRLAQQLEWLGCEAGFYGAQSSGPSAEAFLERQGEVLATVEKIERELKGAVRFNLSALVGVEYCPLEETFDSISELLGAVEDVKRSAVFSIPELPSKVRQFSRLVEGYVDAASPVGV
jgi:hypothetical protein